MDDGMNDRTDNRMNNPSKAKRERVPREPSEVDSRLLLGSTGRVLIQHRGQTYELRETRYGKLILTK
jgi:hemin uptake protein HemP